MIDEIHSHHHCTDIGLIDLSRDTCDYSWTVNRNSPSKKTGSCLAPHIVGDHDTMRCVS